MRSLQNRIEKSNKAAGLELQSKCAKQALEVFKLLGYDATQMSGFHNHYNENFNKCFVEIEDTTIKDGTVATSKSVTDAFEGRVYGTYIWINSKGQQYWAVPPSECKVWLLSGEEKTCHSSDEFDALTKEFLQ